MPIRRQITHHVARAAVARRRCSGRPLRLGALLAIMSGAGCQHAENWTMFEPVQRDRRELPADPPDVAGHDAWSARSADSPRRSPFPDGPIAITVEQAALLALENNRDLRVQRYNPEITESFEDIERGVFDPEVFASAAFGEEVGTEISRATGENFSTTVRDTAVEGGIRQTLPSGTTVEAIVSSERSTSDRAPEQQVARVGLTVTQALLQGYGPAVNLARVRQAELQTTASRYQLQAFTESLLAETETTYWLYTLAARRIAIFEQSLEVARQQQQEVADRIELGELADSEMPFAEAEVALREQDLIDARATQDTLRLELLRLINPTTTDLFDRAVHTTTDPAIDAAPLDDIDQRIELAVQARPDLNEARLLLEQQRLETIVTRNGLLPRLDFFLTLGKTGYANELPKSFNEIGDDTYDLAAGLDFTYPLDNRTAKGIHRAATLSRRQAAAAIDNLAQLIRRDVHIAAVEVERARQQIAASAATRQLREAALTIEQERLRLGTTTSLLVAQAQRDLLESQIAEVDAVVAYRIALINLYLAEGTLLSRRGLLVEH